MHDYIITVTRPDRDPSRARAMTTSDASVIVRDALVGAIAGTTVSVEVR